MALPLENQRNVWRKVEQFLDSHDGGSASAQARNAIKAFADAFITQKSNSALLQFVPFGAADIVTNLGYGPLDVPAKVYMLYAKNPNASGGTDSYITLHNAANNASVPFITGLIQVADDEFVYMNARGMDFTTDVVVSGATTAGGATESSAADACDGFVIVGAA